MDKEIDKSYANYLNYIHKVVQGPNEIEGNWYTRKEFVHQLLNNESFCKKWCSDCYVKIKDEQKPKKTIDGDKNNNPMV